MLLGDSTFFFGVLGDDFEEYKGITTLDQAPFYLFFFLFSTTFKQQLSYASHTCKITLILSEAKKLKEQKIDLPSPKETNVCFCPRESTTVDFSFEVTSIVSRQCYCILNEIAFAVTSPPFDLL